MNLHLDQSGKTSAPSGCLTEQQTQAVSLPGLITPEVGKAFVASLWGELAAGRLSFETHNHNLLRKNAIETNGDRYAPLGAFHWGLTPTVEKLLARRLIPHFSYFRLYYEGDICRIHSDRADCEISMSLTLASSDDAPWELNVGTWPAEQLSPPAEDFGEEPFVSFAMSAGDAVLYRGPARRHGRLAPNPNRWSAHAFLEWVDSAGPYASEALNRLQHGAIAI